MCNINRESDDKVMAITLIDARAAHLVSNSHWYDYRFELHVKSKISSIIDDVVSI